MISFLIALVSFQEDSKNVDAMREVLRLKPVFFVRTEPYAAEPNFEPPKMAHYQFFSNEGKSVVSCMLPTEIRGIFLNQDKTRALSWTFDEKKTHLKILDKHGRLFAKNMSTRVEPRWLGRDLILIDASKQFLCTILRQNESTGEWIEHPFHNFQFNDIYVDSPHSFWSGQGPRKGSKVDLVHVLSDGTIDKRVPIEIHRRIELAITFGTPYLMFFEPKGLFIVNTNASKTRKILTVSANDVYLGKPVWMQKLGAFVVHHQPLDKPKIFSLYYPFNNKWKAIKVKDVWPSEMIALSSSEIVFSTTGIDRKDRGMPSVYRLDVLTGKVRLLEGFVARKGSLTLHTCIQI